MAVAASTFNSPGGALAGGADRSARIGPNAVIQLLAAMNAAGLSTLATTIFTACGSAIWLTQPPGGMVDERKVARLHQAVRSALPAAQADALMRDAGRRTADYLLANRIPRPVQVILKFLPPRPAAFILVAAIRRNAWTFAGSGHFRARTGVPTILEIADNPVCAGEAAPAQVCAWHAGVFERLFQVLVSPHTRVTETDCEAKGGSACRFEARWSPQ